MANVVPFSGKSKEKDLFTDCTVLDCEDREQYESLLNLFMEDYAPQTHTAKLLIEELASTFWKKRRATAAELAIFNRGIHNTIHGFNNPMEASTQHAAVPTRTEFDEKVSMAEVLALSPNEIVIRQEKSAETIARLTKITYLVEAVLDHQGNNNSFDEDEMSLVEREVFEKAAEMLTASERQEFDRMVSTLQYRATPLYIRTFINDNAMPDAKNKAEYNDRLPAIQNQIIGDSMKSEKLDKLLRYSSNLDRKTERIINLLNDMSNKQNSRRQPMQAI